MTEISPPSPLRPHLQALLKTVRQSPMRAKPDPVQTERIDAFRADPHRLLQAMQSVQPKASSADALKEAPSDMFIAPEHQQATQSLAQHLRTLLHPAQTHATVDRDQLIRSLLHLDHPNPDAPLLIRILGGDRHARALVADMDPAQEPFFFELLLVALSKALSHQQHKDAVEQARFGVEEKKAEQNTEPKEDKYKRLARKLADRAKRYIPEAIKPDPKPSQTKSTPLKAVEMLTPVAAITKPTLKKP